MKEHTHNFPSNIWPFKEPINGEAFTTKKVVYENYPIVLITHDEDGGWQFLCGTTTEAEDCVVACLGCIFEHHPFVKEFASLPKGWLAWRENEESPWQTEEQEDE